MNENNTLARPAAKEKVTQEQVEFWLGSDHTLKEAIATLTDIANGDYKPKQLSEEILDLWDQS